jgi:hypothetical protein
MILRSAVLGAAWILAGTLSAGAQGSAVSGSESSRVLSPVAISTEQSAESYCQSLVSQDGPRGQAFKNACVFSLSLGHQMPNFICDMEVEKFEDINQSYKSTHYMQRIHARARYYNGKDSYDDLSINGRPSDKTQLVEGTWSFGEFGAKLLAAFSPKNRPNIRFERETKINGVPAYEFSFNVDHRRNRFWRWLWGKTSALPGYEGKLWIARRDGTVLRLQLDSKDGVPEDFPIQLVESKTDYSYVDFKDRSGFVLPSKVQIRTQMLDHRLYRTQISYSKCQRFKVESRIVPASVSPQP